MKKKPPMPRRSAPPATSAVTAVASGSSRHLLPQSLTLGLALTVLAGAISCTSETQPSTSDDSIVIGYLAEDIERSASTGNLALLFMAAKEINDAGGLRVDGAAHQVDIEVAYHDATVESTVEAFYSLTEQGITAVLGPAHSSAVLGTAAANGEDGLGAAARDTGVVLVSPTASSPAITDIDDDGFVFRTVPSDSYQGSVGAQVLADRGRQKVAVLARDDSYGRGVAQAMTARFEELGGQVVAELFYETESKTSEQLSQYDFDTELSAAFASGADVLYLVAFDESVQIASRIDLRGALNALAPADFELFATESLYDASVVSHLPARVLQSLGGTSPAPPPESTDYAKFIANLQAAGIGEPWERAPRLYDALYLVAYGMQAAGTTDAALVKSALGPVSSADEGDVTVYADDFSRGRPALLDGDTIDYQGASSPIELDVAGDPSRGDYLVWGVADDGARQYALKVLQSIEL
jgi:branched-chain amino acid transport system substrate-binding protein